VLSLAFYSAYDPVTPAALTPRIAERLLRLELGYEGAAITSDLGSGAVKATGSVPAAAVDALRAGSDLLQIAFPEDQDGVRDALLAAAESGELPRNRLAEAASRVLELKRRLGVIEE
jgi:beta-N-acetylhexosaminidase